MQGLMEQTRALVGLDLSAVLGGRFKSWASVAFVGCDMVGCFHQSSPSRGNSSVGRASGCHPEGREFESRFPLHY